MFLLWNKCNTAKEKMKLQTIVKLSTLEGKNCLAPNSRNRNCQCFGDRLFKPSERFWPNRLKLLCAQFASGATSANACALKLQPLCSHLHTRSHTPPAKFFYVRSLLRICFAGRRKMQARLFSWWHGSLGQRMVNPTKHKLGPSWLKICVNRAHREW